MPTPDPPGRSSPPTARVVAVLDFLARHPHDTFGLSELARRLDLSKPTCLGILTTLTVREGDTVAKGQVIGRIVDSQLGFQAGAYGAQAAVAQAQARAHAGDAVLMSPACASFDMFKDYEHRAHVFCDTVRSLAQDAGQTLEGE